MSSFQPGQNIGQNTSFQLGSAPDPAASGETVGQHFQTGAFGADDPFGLANVSMMAGGTAGMSMSGALMSERYHKILKKMQELAKDPNNEQRILRHIVALDKGIFPTIHFAVILVAVQSKMDPDATVGYQALIVDGTNTPLLPQEETTNHVTSSISRFAESVFDKDLRDMAVARLMNTIPGAAANNIFFTAPVVLGVREVDANNETQISMILNNAVLAAQTIAARNAGHLHGQAGKHLKDINFVEQQAKKQLPEMYISHRVTQSMMAADEVGNLTRTSMISSVQTGKPQKNDKYAPNSNTASRMLEEVSTFTDLMPVSPIGHQTGPYANINPAYAQMYGLPTQPLRPLVVITGVRSQFSLTPAATELAVLIATDQASPRTNRWAEDLRHKGNHLGGLDLGDIGAILVNMPNPNAPGSYMPKVKASDPQFEDEHLWRLVGEYIRPQALVAMDVPTAGAQSWYLGVYAAAALKNANAIKLLHETVNTATGGKYQELIAASGKPAPEMFLPEVYYLERGTWRQGDKILPLDLVDNYVAVCCYAREHNAPYLVNEYVATMTNSGYSQMARIEKRRSIIMQMTNQTAEFTRSVRRVIFNPASRDLINQAYNAAGIVFHSDESVQINMASSANYAQGLASVAGMTTPLAVQGNSQVGATYNMGSTFGF